MRQKRSWCGVSARGGGAEKGETARNPGCRAQRWVVEVLDEQVPQG